jgi:hypothetical protein
MNFQNFLNAFDVSDEHCASLTPSFCPEIIDLLNSQRLQAKKTFSMLLQPVADYGFDEHAHGLC